MGKRFLLIFAVLVSYFEINSENINVPKADEFTPNKVSYKPSVVGTVCYNQMAKKKKICCIYKITSPSGKIYIGQTTDLKHRINCYNCHLAPKQRKLHASFIKYSIDNHIIDVVYCLEQYNKNLLDELEIHYIQIYNSTGKNGLNLLSGGNSGGKHSQETKDLIRFKATGRKMSAESSIKKSIASTGEKNPFYGKKHTESTKKTISKTHAGKTRSFESRQKQSKSTSGRKNHFYNKTHDENAIKKIRIKLIGNKNSLGVKKTNSTKNKISSSRKGLKFASKVKIIQMDLNGNLIKIWDSIKEAHSFFGVKSGSIGSTLNGNQKTSYGFKWKYYEK